MGTLLAKDGTMTLDPALRQHRLGWIGTGRMGYAMAARLLRAGCQMAVYNRTRSKADPLQSLGASIVDSPADLANCDIVFTSVSASADLLSVIHGPQGLFTAQQAPHLLIDCSSVSEEASSQARTEAARRGAQMLAAPVSGNAKVVEAGKLTLVVSGPADAYRTALPYLEQLGAGVSYVGEGELARIVKICHNLLLGVITEALAEITLLAQKAGVPRSALLEFINNSVMGSPFTRYKTPAFVNLDFKPTFTPVLLRKDLDLGLHAANTLAVPLPLVQLTRDIVQQVIDGGETERDFAVLLLHAAKAAGMQLQPEGKAIDDGLHSASM
jgi:3-hydroxyisobutyrate dehydrogenase-like beta-hydroxyacid dehydrogenase